MEIKVGISSCLLGEKVRFDGQHKKDAWILGLLGPYVRWVSVCPEVEAGMTVPREPIQLVRQGKSTVLLTTRTGIDVTAQIRDYSEKKVEQLRKLDLTGYVLKKGSPSCGLERVKRYEKNGYAKFDGQGLFAEALVTAFPELPVEEEGRLQDAVLRENFIERLFAYHRVKAFFQKKWSLSDLVTFHSQHKLQLLAHSTVEYNALGKLVAQAKKKTRADIETAYTSLFMTAMKKMATPGKNANSLEHMAGHFKKLLSSAEKAELVTIIKDYRTGLVPLIVPITLIRHYVNRFSIEYLKGQTFLEPNPKELMLRNHV